MMLLEIKITFTSKKKKQNKKKPHESERGLI